jgi:hypothetical protein
MTNAATVRPARVIDGADRSVKVDLKPGDEQEGDQAGPPHEILKSASSRTGTVSVVRSSYPFQLL